MVYTVKKISHPLSSNSQDAENEKINWAQFESKSAIKKAKFIFAS